MTPTDIQHQSELHKARSTARRLTNPKPQLEQIALVVIKDPNYQITHHPNPLAQRSPHLPLWCRSRANASSNPACLQLLRTKVRTLTRKLASYHLDLFLCTISVPYCKYRLPTTGQRTWAIFFLLLDLPQVSYASKPRTVHNYRYHCTRVCYELHRRGCYTRCSLQEH
jgi:hypothetical protein